MSRDTLSDILLSAYLRSISTVADKGWPSIPNLFLGSVRPVFLSRYLDNLDISSDEPHSAISSYRWFPPNLSKVETHDGPCENAGCHGCPGLLILSLEWRSGTSPTQSQSTRRQYRCKESRRWVRWTPCTSNTNTKLRRRYHRCSPCSRALARSTNIPTTSRANMPSTQPPRRNPMEHNSCINIRCSKRQIGRPLNRPGSAWESRLWRVFPAAIKSRGHAPPFVSSCLVKEMLSVEIPQFRWLDIKVLLIRMTMKHTISPFG